MNDSHERSAKWRETIEAQKQASSFHRRMRRNIQVRPSARQNRSKTPNVNLETAMGTVERSWEL